MILTLLGKALYSFVGNVLPELKQNIIESKNDQLMVLLRICCSASIR